LSTLARLIFLQSQVQALLQANGSADGFWLIEQQWCWLTVLANGNGCGVAAAISAQHAPFQLSALDWQQQVRWNRVTSRQFYWRAAFGGMRLSAFVSNCLSLTLSVSSARSVLL
jgi:hypothetical protein